MSYDLYTGAPDDDKARVAWLMQLFHSARTQRVNFETQWEEGASLVWPEYRSSFGYGHRRAPGTKYTQYQVDSTGTIAAWRFMAIADALLTPFSMMWSQIRVDDPYLMRRREVQMYCDDVSQALWAQRYAPTANFQTQQQTNWQALGVFGNIGMWVDEYDAAPMKGPKGLRYMACPPGEIYILVNHQGRVDGCIRNFKWTARQAYQRWGDKIDAAPALKAALEKADAYTLFDFLQFVVPRTDYDPMQVFTDRSKPWSSVYVSEIGYAILEEGGYYTFPLAYGRYSQAPDEWYARGPAQQVLPELKTKNAEKEAFLKQGALAGDPMYLLPEDGMFDFKAQAGQYNYGGMSPDGKPLVGTLPTGNIQITKELMQDSDKNINAAFLVDLFPLLFDRNQQQKSAREVIEVANQMGIFLAPTLGRQYGEYLGSMIDREMDLLKRMRMLPPLPPVLREAQGQWKARVHYTSPLARALTNQGHAGYMRTVEMASIIANASGDPSVWDNFDFDAAIPEMSTDQYSPARWMASAAKRDAARKARARAAERERQVQELPGRAAIMKAQAINTKAATGGNIGGTLSGTPQGGMPMMPQGPQGMPGMPSRIPGQPGTPGMPA